MNKKVSFKGHMRVYIMWPLWMTIPVGVLAVAMYFIDLRAGITATVFTIGYGVVALVMYLRDRGRVVNDLVSFATQYGQVQRQLLRELEVPYALLDENGKIIWTNDALDNTIHSKKGAKKNISNYIPELIKSSLPSIEHETERIVTFEGRDYRVSLRKVSMNALMEETDTIESPDYESYLVAMFMFDVTETIVLQKKIDDQKLACGLIYIDNYEEVLESVEEVRRSLLVALIDRKVNKYLSNVDAIVKKLEKDKFIVLMQKKDLAQMTENRFELLEDVKTVNIGNEIAVTLSIGIGVDSDSFQTNYEYARTAIDLALGRGGDQAIIKSSEDIAYFGGKSQMAEKSTRVKARVKAHALREIIENSERIIIMGHKLPDMDAFGSAVGIYRVAKTLGKKANIVVDEASNSIKTMMETICNDGSHEEDLVINNQEAIEISSRPGVTLVVVDVNKPSYTECPELLGRCSSVVVLDHHRQGSEKIENATLSYVEPYASSASEMVAEVLQYISEDVRLMPDEADCLYSGMMIDTNNFMTKTGVRTFEAAAYLRRNGADVTRVRKLFRDSVDDYKARAEIVRNAVVIDEAFAISITPDSVVDNPTIIGAEAANELLNIRGIKASFVLTPYQNAVYISARSIDEINVQLIMEKLNGGGHMNIAGAQIKDSTIEEAKQILINTIRDMKEKGEI